MRALPVVVDDRLDPLHDVGPDTRADVALVGAQLLVEPAERTHDVGHACLLGPWAGRPRRPVSLAGAESGD